MHSTKMIAEAACDFAGKPRIIQLQHSARDRRLLGPYNCRYVRRAAHFRTANELAMMARRVGLTVGAVNGAIFFPPWTELARLMAPLDPSLGKITTLGAAFVAVQATKP